MPKNKKTYITIILILLLAYFAANFVYPPFFQKLGIYPNFISQKDFKLGLDLQGGVRLVYQADFSNIEEKEKGGTMEGLKDVIERRVNLFGVKEPLVQIEGEKLVVELAGVVDPAQAIAQIGQTPFLEFREQKENYDEIMEKNNQVFESGGGEIEDPFQPASLTGKYLEKAQVIFDQTTYQPLVSLQFNEEGARLFEELTAKNVGKRLAIYIDGFLISAPIVQEPIAGGKAQISGQFTVEEAKELAQNLNAGALPVPIKLVSQQSIGPTLGKISLEQTIKAGVIGFLAVILFIIIFYRLPGFFASISLCIYLIFLLALFKLIPVTLTLAGIAGFLLSLGMAVDANILIFSRMREELKQGREPLKALEEGSRRAWPAIRDGNFTTILVGVILYFFGTSFVQGFAFTLIIGNFISMFSAVFITNNFLRIVTQTRLNKFSFLW